MKKNIIVIEILIIIAIIISLTRTFYYALYYGLYNKSWQYTTLTIIGGYIVIILTIILARVILKAVTLTENVIQKAKNNDGNIYVRDMDSPLSPAAVSYLVNNKIELKKDIVATVLSLIAKKQLLINENLQIIDSGNQSTLSNLSDDELYVYWWFVKKEDEFDKNYFLNAVKNELKDYIYIKREKINWQPISTIIILIGFILMMITAFIDIHNIQLIAIIMFSTLGIMFATGIWVAIKSYIPTKRNKYFTYTKKGTYEILNWEKFKKFMEDFGRLEDYELDSIILWDKYLAFAIALNINKEYKSIRIKDVGQRTKLNINVDVEEEIEKRLVGVIE